MTEQRQPLIDNAALPWIGLGIVLIFVVAWTLLTGSQSAIPTPGSPQPTDALILKVEPATGEPATNGTANPQQVGSADQNAASSPQSGQPNLQPATTNSEQFKQETGL